jgi:HAD superfamily hydrolase (TIGR01484 family)
MHEPLIDEQTVIAADLDGTLAQSKLPLGDDMAAAMSKWLETNRFAIISGGAYEQFQKQVVSRLPEGTHFEHLYLFPTNGAACYQFKDGGWTEAYRQTLSGHDQELIARSIEQAVVEAEITIERKFGEQIAFRGGQVTFSALGQEAPLSENEQWDPYQLKRKKIVSFLEALIPEFNISIGGTTSIDVTEKGIDKAYALIQMKRLLNVDSDHIIFFGDALFAGGNDEPAIKTGAHCISVLGPENTLYEIKRISSMLPRA